MTKSWGNDKSCACKDDRVYQNSKKNKNQYKLCAANTKTNTLWRLPSRELEISIWRLSGNRCAASQNLSCIDFQTTHHVKILVPTARRHHTVGNQNLTEKNYSTAEPHNWNFQSGASTARLLAVANPSSANQFSQLVNWSQLSAVQLFDETNPDLPC